MSAHAKGNNDANEPNNRHEPKHVNWNGPPSPPYEPLTREENQRQLDALLLHVRNVEGSFDSPRTPSPYVQYDPPPENEVREVRRQVARLMHEPSLDSFAPAEGACYDCEHERGIIPGASGERYQYGSLILCSDHAQRRLKILLSSASARHAPPANEAT